MIREMSGAIRIMAAVAVAMAMAVFADVASKT